MIRNLSMIMVFFISVLQAQTIYKDIPPELDSSKSYIFYLHGRIIEVQGIRPVSDKYGVYEYEKIVQTIASKGFIVISEARPADTRAQRYAEKTAGQIDSLLSFGIPPENITVIGASKGAGIAVLVSSLLKNEKINFVLMAICNKRMAEFWKNNNIKLWGRVLYIYDYKDVIAGSCNDYLDILTSEGLKEFKEIEVKLGLGHGLLFRPLKEWIEPSIKWARRIE